MGKLEGRVAVITGGTTGIGLATASLFVSEGAFVFIVGMRQPELDTAVEKLGEKSFGVQGDVANLSDLARLHDIVKARRGVVDVVFANAGILEHATLDSITAEHFARLVDTNVKGALFTVQKMLPLLSDGAAIILTGSVAGSKGTVGQSVYSATKAALRSFARTWTSELKDRRIRANVVSPGPIGTAPVAHQSAEAIGRMVSGIPLGRLGDPEEIAKAVLFLACGDSSFVTGAELFVDGGRAQV
jgi:NAD(P)-dependent dehydrogenase (short-subunit alcohol dehydrogenase family)